MTRGRHLEQVRAFGKTLDGDATGRQGAGPKDGRPEVRGNGGVRMADRDRDIDRRREVRADLEMEMLSQADVAGRGARVRLDTVRQGRGSVDDLNG